MGLQPSYTNKNICFHGPQKVLGKLLQKPADYVWGRDNGYHRKFQTRPEGNENEAKIQGNQLMPNSNLSIDPKILTILKPTFLFFQATRGGG